MPRALLLCALASAPRPALAQEALPAAFSRALQVLRSGPAGQDALPPAEGAAVEDAPDPVVRSVDLSDQFPDGPRRQEDVASCHAFAAVALLEAAYYRRHGERARFSEADLMIRRTLLRPDAYREFAAEGEADLSEENWMHKDVKFALRRGLASSLDYGEFLERYRSYREAERRTLADLERQRAALPEETLREYDPREHWARLQQEGLSRRLVERRLGGGGEALEEERRRSRERFRGLRARVRRFHGDSDDEASGWAQSEAIREALDAGRPAGVAGAGHAFVATGYRLHSSGRLVFQTRDSDGGDELHAEDCWMIGYVVTVED